MNIFGKQKKFFLHSQITLNLCLLLLIVVKKELNINCSGSRPYYAGEIYNPALFLWLGLPSTLIRHENRGFRRYLKTPALRLNVDGIQPRSQGPLSSYLEERGQWERGWTEYTSKSVTFSPTSFLGSSLEDGNNEDGPLPEFSSNTNRKWALIVRFSNFSV